MFWETKCYKNQEMRNFKTNIYGTSTDNAVISVLWDFEQISWFLSLWFLVPSPSLYIKNKHHIFPYEDNSYSVLSPYWNSRAVDSSCGLPPWVNLLTSSSLSFLFVEWRSWTSWYPAGLLQLSPSVTACVDLCFPSTLKSSGWNAYLSVQRNIKYKTLCSSGT